MMITHIKKLLYGYYYIETVHKENFSVNGQCIAIKQNENNERTDRKI